MDTAALRGAAGRPREPGQLRAGLALRVAHPGPAGAAARDGRDRHLHLRVPGHAAGARPIDLRRRRRRPEPPARRRWAPARWSAAWSPPAPSRPSARRVGSAGLALGAARGRSPRHADAGHDRGRAGRGRRRQHHLHDARELDPPDHRRPRDARPGGGPLRRRPPREHPDRRPDHGRARPAARRSGRPRDRRRDRRRHGGGRAGGPRSGRSPAGERRRGGTSPSRSDRAAATTIVESIDDLEPIELVPGRPASAWRRCRPSPDRASTGRAPAGPTSDRPGLARPVVQLRTSPARRRRRRVGRTRCGQPPP